MKVDFLLLAETVQGQDDGRVNIQQAGTDTWFAPHFPAEFIVPFVLATRRRRADTGDQTLVVQLHNTDDGQIVAEIVTPITPGPWPMFLPDDEEARALWALGIRFTPRAPGIFSLVVSIGDSSASQTVRVAQQERRPGDI